ncbi:SdrD B-like domain-containing protein [Lentzea kentuckyensis]|uniref:SdrD B-like domain-containing protein n=1 Tax=Lentzea kentuckyensis TaxID=360086 RepID=UPI000A3A9136|nr:SdrD B-like domain-containing protein [Lentzea kentuckyensis]
MKRPLAVALSALMAASFAVVIPTAHAGPGDGTLTVKVIRDVNANGTYEAALEVGVAGASVLVTDPAGKTATGTTAADGNVTVGLGSVSGGKYRVQVNPPAGSPLVPAPAGAGLESNTMFVDVSGGQNKTVTTALWNPADYCQANPTLVTGCQRATRKSDGSSNVNDAARSLITFPFTNRGTAPAPAQIANQGATGSVYGIAYRKQDKRIFSGAFAKRLTDYGPGSAGGIYVTPAAGGATTLFATVPSAGITKHNHQNNFDGGFANVVGKEALGDIDISEDGSELYVVNLGDRKLYVYDATAATAAAAKASYAIPSSCPNANDWRPGALGVRDGVLYVGGVCSGETTQNAADMRVVVRTFTAGAFSAPVINQPLTFRRGTVLWQGTNTDHWLPWQTTFKQPTPTGGLVEHPEPLLTDLGVEANGDLVLAFRDRFGDQGGKSLSPADGSAGQWDTVSGGDLNRACRQANGSYAWEGTSTCPNNGTADVVEYYPGEYYKDANGAPHNETAQGALAVVYGESRMPAMVMDPTAINTGGTGWFDRATGGMMADGYPNAYLISDVNTEGWGKANGLADLEALCDLAPVQLGNRVWFDTDADGTQDGDEPAIAGVKVTATPCAGGAALGTKVTNAKGEYYFGVADGLKPETCYNLTFDRSAVNAGGLPNAPDPANLKWTVKEAGPDRVIDSNVDADGKTQVTTGKAGTADHTVDAGIVAKVTNKLGDLVWVDANRNGLQDADEPGVPGVTVVLKNGDGTQVGQPTKTDAQGKYLFDQLDDGVYKVCFDLSTLPSLYAGFTFTGKDAGDDAKDSDADPADGCTATTTLGAAKREDLTLDAGISPPSNKVGDFVWKDTNRNGVQDGDEPGVPGVTVTLKNGAGEPVGQPKQTGADGKYLFDNLPDGTYQVCFDISTAPAEYAGYLLTKPNAGDDLKDSDADPTSKCTQTTTVGPNKREDLTLDAGIRPPNKLGDYVWIDNNKNGLQDDGEPGVPDVPVKLSNGATTKTGPDGKYVFDKLPDGKYTVCFDIKNLPGPVADYQVTKPNAGDDAKDSDADVATGCAPEVELSIDKPEDLTIDMGLISPVNRLGDYVWIDVNKDGLQDASDVPVEGVTVKLSTGATTKTGADGKYLFTDLPDGTYKVCFDLANLPAAVKDYKVTTQNAGGDDAKDSDAGADGCTAETTLGTGKREDLTLDMGLVSPPNRLGDYVWVDTNRNGVQDGGEPGVPGVTVKVGDKTTTTNDQGKYVFDDLSDGTYKVCFDIANMPAPYQAYLVTRPNAGGDDVKDSDAGADGCTPETSLGSAKREDLTLDLGIRPPNKLGDTVWRDDNKNGLQDPNEPGVPGVTVKVGDKTTTTNEQGKYEFPNLPDGKYQVCFDIKNLPGPVADYQVTKPNAGDDAKDSDADVATGCAPEVELNVDKPEDPTIDMGLISPVNRLGDYVWIDVNKDGLQDASDIPVEGVTVKLSTGATTKTGADGKYLFTDLPDGTYKVCFDLANLPANVKDYKVTTQNAGGDDAADSDAGADGCTAETTLGTGKREDLTLDMGLVSPPNKLGDTVWRDDNKNGVQDDGEPGVPNVPVKLSDGKTTVTDPNGKYVFDNLPDGKYTVCFGPMPDAVKDFVLTTPNVGSDDAKDSDADPATGCTPEVELGLGKRENLTVDAGIHPPANGVGDYVWIDANKNGLQDEGEKPVEGVTAVLKDAQGKELGTQKTSSTGKYYFTDNLPDGTYQVCFDIKNLPAAVADYTLTKPNAGDDTKDSDADPATGCTLTTTVGIGKRRDYTLDAGLIAPPNKLGDLVWSDKNRNGVQDPGEPGVPGVPVKLLDAGGKPVGEPVKTDKDGRYEFPNIPDGTYKVCFEMGALPGDYAGYQATKPNIGDDAKDSDVDPASGCTPPVTVGVGKRENLTLDLGLVSPANRVGDFVWYDNNSNGVQDAGEPGVPDLPVFLQDGAGKPVAQGKTDKDGKYLFTDLPDGEYKVCFNADPQTGLVAGRKLTTPHVGDDGKDSDADPASGCTHVVKLGKDKRVDLTLDAGLLPKPPAPPLASTGVTVWSLLLAALTMLAGGAYLLLKGRRRRES